ncbi:3,4-dihydroxy-2-butanone-4-phosphate synthase [Massilia sp. SR12]
MAGLGSYAMLCELMHPGGTIRHGAAVETFAQLHSMPILTIAEMIELRRKR